MHRSLIPDPQEIMIILTITIIITETNVIYYM